MSPYKDTRENRAGSDEATETVAARPERSRSRTDFLRTLFRLLDECDIRYCVLHSWEGLPEELPSDLDLAAHPRDVHKLPLVFRSLKEKGYSVVQCLNYFVNAYYFVFFWFDGPAAKSVPVDIIFEHRRSGLIVPSGEALVAGRRKQDIFWVPEPAAEFAYLLAKKTWKGNVFGRQAQRLKLLVEQLGRSQAERIAGELFRKRWRRQVVEGCAKGCALILPKTQPWWTSLARDPLKLTGYLFADGRRRIRRWLQPTGLFVVILGPDGVGKTTLINHLVQVLGPAFRRHRVFHWRPMLLWRRKDTGPVTEPHGRPEHPAWWSVARLFSHLLDYWFGYGLVIRPLLARSGLVVFDRYFHDLLVDPRRYRYGGPLWPVRALRPLIPKPDLVLLLDAPEEVILSRKQEVAPEQVQLQRRNYLRQANEFSRVCVIDAALPLPQVIAGAGGAVTEYLAQRFQRRHGFWLALGERPAQSQSLGRVQGVPP